MNGKFLFKTICPCCLRKFEPGMIWIDYPICSDCNSEGMELEVVPFIEFMEKNSAEDLLRRKLFYQDREQLLPAYRALLIQRIDDLIQEKAGSDNSTL